MGQFKVGGTLFPEQSWLNKEFRGLLKQNIFAEFKLVLETQFMQMRLVLKSGEQSLPFMVWSAGQREFVPLLLGLYWLLPSSTARRRGKSNGLYSKSLKWASILAPLTLCS